MSVVWKREWTTDDFIAYCDKLEDRDTAFLLKEYVSKRIRALADKNAKLENDASDARWVRDQQLGYVQGSN